MKPARLAFVALLLVILCMPLFSYAETYFIFSDEETKPVEIENPDFRNAKWNMTKEDVIIQESGLKIEENSENGLMYKDTVDAADMLVIYSFDNNRLVRGLYALDSEKQFSQPGLYIGIYENIKSAMIEKYGKLKEDDKRWINSSYKITEEDMAFRAGALAYYCEWNTETTKITLVLLYDTNSREVMLGIQYESLNYQKEDDTKIKI